MRDEPPAGPYAARSTDIIYDKYLHCAKLTATFFIDAYIKIQEVRLLYVQYHQVRLKVEKYSILQEAVANGLG